MAIGSPNGEDDRVDVLCDPIVAPRPIQGGDRGTGRWAGRVECAGSLTDRFHAGMLFMVVLDGEPAVPFTRNPL